MDFFVDNHRHMMRNHNIYFKIYTMMGPKKKKILIQIEARVEDHILDVQHHLLCTTCTCKTLILHLRRKPSFKTATT